ncbi:uncharacterized protein [Musca autumnalis]|uniref:uncharacterized protein n=1 Tax=Musca autumnalis TaxID=221902 RepID=UPI003CEEF90F
MKVKSGQFILIALFVYSNSSNTIAYEKTWTYDMKSVEVYSANPDVIDLVDWKVERISRGVYGLSGKWLVKTDIIEGDGTEIEYAMFRSRSGTKKFQQIPFQIERQHLFDYFNGIYKYLFMNSVKNCSNLPVFEDKFEPPLKKKTYALHNCIFDEEKLPQYVQEGFYKVDLIGSGKANWYLNLTAQVQNAL